MARVKVQAAFERTAQLLNLELFQRMLLIAFFLLFCSWVTCSQSSVEKILSRFYKSKNLPSTITKILFEDSCPVDLAKALKSFPQNVKLVLDSGAAADYNLLPLQLCLKWNGINFYFHSSPKSLFCPKNAMIFLKLIERSAASVLPEEIMWTRRPSWIEKQLLWRQGSHLDIPDEHIVEAQACLADVKSELLVQDENDSSAFFFLLISLRETEDLHEEVELGTRRSLLDRLIRDVKVRPEHLAGWLAVMMCSELGPKRILACLEQNNQEHDPKTLQILRKIASTEKEGILSIKEDMSSREILKNYLTGGVSLKDHLKNIKLAFISIQFYRDGRYGLIARRDVVKDRVIELLKTIPINQSNVSCMKHALFHFARQLPPKFLMEALEALGIKYSQQGEKLKKFEFNQRNSMDQIDAMRELAKFIKISFLNEYNDSSAKNEIIGDKKTQPQEDDHSRLGGVNIALDDCKTEAGEATFAPEDIIPHLNKIIKMESKHFKNFLPSKQAIMKLVTSCREGLEDEKMKGQRIHEFALRSPNGQLRVVDLRKHLKSSNPPAKPLHQIKTIEDSLENPSTVVKPDTTLMSPRVQPKLKPSKEEKGNTDVEKEPHSKVLKKATTKKPKKIKKKTSNRWSKNFTPTKFTSHSTLSTVQENESDESDESDEPEQTFLPKTKLIFNNDKRSDALDNEATKTVHEIADTQSRQVIALESPPFSTDVTEEPESIPDSPVQMPSPKIPNETTLSIESKQENGAVEFNASPEHYNIERTFFNPESTTYIGRNVEINTEICHDNGTRFEISIFRKNFQIELFFDEKNIPQLILTLRENSSLVVRSDPSCPYPYSFEPIILGRCRQWLPGEEGSGLIIELTEQRPSQCSKDHFQAYLSSLIKALYPKSIIITAN